MRWWGVVVLAAGGMLLGACSASKPSRPGDLCAVFGEKPEWYESARASYRRWGVPVPLQLAVIHQESGFDSDARPPRTKILGFIPGPRPSSAYGYGQVLDSTWDWYRDSTGESGADRDEFEDVTDFIGWYGHVGHRRHGIDKADPFQFYVSYLAGHHGYLRGAYRRRHVRKIGERVVRRTREYSAQYTRCRRALDEQADSSWWWPF